tara:strand:+ start:1195 stop:1413 length:219 start_codon:yes stop_codon:yes gene_type:complete
MCNEMGSSECEICKENDYLDEYIVEEHIEKDGFNHIYYPRYWVCRNCVEQGLKLRIKQIASRSIVRLCGVEE